jgi:hypothetical protein
MRSHVFYRFKNRTTEQDHNTKSKNKVIICPRVCSTKFYFLIFLLLLLLFSFFLSSSSSFLAFGKKIFHENRGKFLDCEENRWRLPRK